MKKILVTLAFLLLSATAATTARADLATGRIAFEAGDYQAAVAAFRSLAEAGDTEAEYWLGRSYDGGFGR